MISRLDARSLSLGALVSLAVSLAVLPYLVALLLPSGVLYGAVAEDGIIEWIGSAAWALACLVFIRVLWSPRGGVARPNRFWSGGLALLCFLAAGEEISWGQRVIGYETPSLIADANLQQEMNFHNLQFLDSRVSADGNVKKQGLAAWLSFGRLGLLTWMGFLVALPIVYRLLEPARALADRLRLPVPPLFVAGLGIVSYWSSRVLFDNADAIGDDPALIRISADEINETIVAALFLSAAIVIYRRGRSPLPTDSHPRSGPS